MPKINLEKWTYYFKKQLGSPNLLSINNKKFYVDILCKIAKARALSNPQHAEVVFQQAINAMNHFPEGQNKIYALCHIARGWALINPNGAALLCDQARDYATVQRGEWRHSIELNSSYIAKEKAFIELTHPEKALATARDILNYAYKSSVLYSNCQSTRLNKH